MRSTLSALARCLAILGCYALIALLIPLTLLTKWATGGGLWALEWAKRRLAQLKRGA